jgi:hypothetical protein
VSTERNLFAQSDCNAIRIASEVCMQKKFSVFSCQLSVVSLTRGTVWITRRFPRDYQEPFLLKTEN